MQVRGLDRSRKKHKSALINEHDEKNITERKNIREEEV
jgi:hypothetical protein